MSPYGDNVDRYRPSSTERRPIEAPNLPRLFSKGTFGRIRPLGPAPEPANQSELSSHATVRPQADGSNRAPRLMTVCGNSHALHSRRAARDAHADVRPRPPRLRYGVRAVRDDRPRDRPAVRA